MRLDGERYSCKSKGGSACERVRIQIIYIRVFSLKVDLHIHITEKQNTMNTFRTRANFCYYN
jgi:hypothetical protein